nr:MAG TPA: hypothetical protein [Caudoviricetes sp.]
MAFIKKESKVGKKVTLTREIRCCAGYFEKGTEVTITGKGEHGYDIVDDQGNHVYECGWDL